MEGVSSHKYLTAPNLFTLTRLLCLPVFLWLLFGTEDYLAAAELYFNEPVGAACTVAGRCASGFCVDGVCCAEACTGRCQACSAAKKASGADGVCGQPAHLGRVLREHDEHGLEDRLAARVADGL